MKIGIVGLGLIGSCLGLDLRQAGHQVYGVGRRQANCEAAIAAGIADTASDDLTSLAVTELIFVCTPIAAILPTVEQLAAVLPAAVVVTDVGSVKGPIAAAATRIWPNFVGGHPMSGKAAAGIAAAQPHLFRGNPYILTPVDSTGEPALAQVKALAEQLGAVLSISTPEAHDRAVAWISHLPVMVSAGLIQACLSEPEAAIQHLAQQVASSGFRDTSRVGGGNPELGLMMAQYNRAALLDTLQAYQQVLKQLEAAIAAEDWAQLNQLLRQTQQARPQYVS
ncbi:MAG: prephenate/arogenate dehydrogenase [Leptolyngbya sp. SIO4C1]|nr:prephenate/arogenate dehydrogenase [Leptolyngbya sp. SIO4C1]